MGKSNRVIISVRRHATTNKSGYEDSNPNRIISPEGRKQAYELGKDLRSDDIIDAYTSPALRSQQTLVHLMDGAGQLDLEKMFVEESLAEPIVSKEYRQIINAARRTRDERIAYFLTHQDPTEQSITPWEAACSICYFIANANQAYTSETGRIEAITNAPNLECFLETSTERAFDRHLGSKAFSHLEGIELRFHNSRYIVRFRQSEIGIAESRVHKMADMYRSSRKNK